jgi:hypothetical protein
VQGPHAEFADVLIEAVDYGLLLLGPTARKAIYFHLEKDYSLPKERIPEDMQAFTESLNRMFGAGAQVIQRLILENLHSKLGLDLDRSGEKDFLSCVDKAKEEYLNKLENGSQQPSKMPMQIP